VSSDCDCFFTVDFAAKEYRRAAAKADRDKAYAAIQANEESNQEEEEGNQEEEEEVGG
jgi:hypothetical protein